MVGIDEVGRGAWAGPLLVVAASGNPVDSVKDSKLLTKASRNRIHDELLHVCQFGEGWVEPHEIDNHGLSGAMRLGTKRALAALGVDPATPVIMDGPVNYCDASYTNVRCLVRADMTEPIVSAASIYAKVIRDAYMAELKKVFPMHGFESHVGYGTRGHRLALKAHGITLQHRRSYKPVQLYL